LDGGVFTWSKMQGCQDATVASPLYCALDGSGSAIVLLHAGGLDSRMFDADAPSLARLGRVLRYDRSGSGRSPASDRAVDRVAELRVAATSAFGNRPVVLVGSSSGGQLAVDFALAHPRLVAGLVLVGPGLSGAQVSPQRRARMSALAAAARQGGEQLADAWLKDPHLAPYGLPIQTAGLVRTMLRDNAALFVEPSTSVAPGTVLDRLSQLVAPGHVLVGEHDDADNHAMARTLAHDAPALELQVIPGFGHFPMLEHVGWLPRALSKLLEKLDHSQ
jgi:3-oxoadipate enol-lactonase